MLLAVCADRINVVAESGVYRNDLHLVAHRLLQLLEAGHLLAAGHAPGGPELQVNRLFPVQLSQIDLFSIDGFQHGNRPRLSDQRSAGSTCPPLTFIVQTVIGVSQVECATEHEQGRELLDE